MLYAIMVQDAEGAHRAREVHRDAHLAHFRNHINRIALSGPLNNDNGHDLGSLIILEADSAAEASAFIHADPFYDAGVWQEPVVARFKGSIFAPEKFAQLS